jgi:colicin import membrane protein
MKRVCPQCLSALPPRARLCPQCGIAVPEGEAPRPSPGPGAEPAAPTPPEPVGRPAPPGPAYDGRAGSGLAARVRRAFTVAGDLGAARAAADQLKSERDTLVVRLGSAAWEAGIVPAATTPVAGQVHRVDAEIAAATAKVAEIEAQLAGHDRVAGERSAQAEAEAKAAAAARDQAAAERDRILAEVREAEREIEALEAEAARAAARARAARDEADALGHADLSAEARVRREAELDAERVEAERASADARSQAGALGRALAERREALDAAGEAASAAQAEWERVEADRSARKQNLDKLRAELAGLAAEGRARAGELRVERSQLLAQLGWVVAVNRPPYGPLEPLYAEADRLDERLGVARDRVAALDAERAGLRATRIVVIAAVIALMIAVFLLAFVYAARG